ncbi:MAG TPA: hypothetical protein VGK59_08500 [Ohtaekwangia sp.]
MKRIMFMLVALVASVAVQASVVGINEMKSQAQVAQDDRVKIKAEELPETVKKSLEAEEYRGWLISSAHHIKSKDQFEIELKNGAETKTVTFDKEGKKVG